jgi:hypothetical protein
MASRTLYVRPEDEPAWRELEALGARRGISTSLLVAEAIRRLLKTDGGMVDVE